jgi:hypothetical protein
MAKGGKKKPFKLPKGAVKGGGSGKAVLTPVAARYAIEGMLNRAKRGLENPEPGEAESLGLKQSLDISVSSFEYVSGSIDGMLTIRAIPRGVSVHKLLVYMESRFGEVPETFISVGLRYSAPEGIKSADYRYRGLAVAHTNYQRSSLRRKIRENFGIARQVNENLTDKRRKKPEQIFVKVHWNPDNVRPERKTAQTTKGKK